MSLINDVLRNLEANCPDVLAGQNLQREIRPLPPAPSARRGLRLGLLMALLAAVSLAAWQGPAYYGGLLLAPPAVQPAVLTEAAPAIAVVAPPTAEAVVPLSENMKLAHELLSLPASETPAVVEPGTPAPLPAAAAPAKEAGATVLPAPAAASPRPAEPAKIEKSPSLATPRDRADTEWRRAETAFAGGRVEEAREALRAALRHDPSHLQARQALLRHLLEVRRLDEAINVLQEGLELQPAQAGWAMSLARLQFEQGDLAAADRTLVRSQSFAENNADYAGFQGHIKSRLGAHRQAAAHYQRATRLAPNDGRWWLGYGLALENDGRLPEGREALRRALAAGNLSGELAAVAEQHLR